MEISLEESNRSFEDNKRALFHAVENEDLEECRKLVETTPALIRGPQCIDTSLNFDISYSALMRAARHGFIDIVKMLLEKRARIDDMTFGERRSALYFAVSEGHHDVVNILLEGGAGVNVGDCGHFPLLAAVEQGNLEIGKILLAYGSRLNFKNRNGGVGPYQELYPRGRKFSALIEAARHDRMDFVILFIQEYKADVNMTNSFGVTALHMAVVNRNLQMIELLLTSGANIKAVDHGGNSATSIAIENNSIEIVRSILEHGVDEDVLNGALHCAVRHGNSEIASLLLEKGSDINSTNDDGDTPLMAAIEARHEDLALLLLEKEADDDVVNNRGDTALSIAAHVNAFSVAKVLLRTTSKKECVRFLTIVESQENEEDIFQALKKAVPNAEEDEEEDEMEPFFDMLDILKPKESSPMMQRLSEENEICRNALQWYFMRQKMWGMGLW